MTHDTKTHFLVPTNFGWSSGVARRAAVRWATGTGARVTLLHVSAAEAQPEEAPDIAALSLLHADAAAGALLAYVDRTRLKQLGDGVHPELREFVNVRTEWRQGDLIAEIAHFADAEAIDAIILGGRRWQIPWGDWAGKRLANKTACPVVIVHEPACPGRTVAHGRSMLGLARRWLAAIRPGAPAASSDADDW